MIVQCKCKCGTEFEEYDKWGNKRRFVNGHQNRGRILSPETKQLMSIAKIGKYCGENNPMFGKHPSPETKQKMSENHADFKGEKSPMFGKTPSDATKQLMSKSHIGIQSGEKHPMFGKHHSPESRQKMSENRPDVSGEKHPMYGKTHSPKARQLISDANTGKICSDATRQLISEANIGENHPNWKGGISKEPYCQEWTPWLKEEIKERDDFKCQNPDCNSSNDLCIHHINYVKKDCSTNNLITICRSCNSKANADREHWQEFYNNILGKD